MRGIVITVVALLASACGDRPRVDRTTVQVELNRVPPPPGAELVRTHRSLKHASAGNHFNSSLSHQEIVEHYRSVLIRGGWQPCNDTRGGRNLGDRTLSFAKGELLASLFLTSYPKEYGLNYSLNVRAARAHSLGQTRLRVRPSQLVYDAGTPRGEAVVSCGLWGLLRLAGAAP